MIVHRADWILPVAGPPLQNGWVAVDHGRIAGCGSGAAAPAGVAGARPFDTDPVVVLPALVNAHTHIELSYLEGRVPPSERFDDWISAVVAVRRQYADPAAVEILDAARQAIGQGRAAGTGLFGDISNTLVTVPLFADAGVAAHVFYELLGFNAADPDGHVRRAREKLDAMGGVADDVRTSLAPHAPYSVSPALFAAIQADLDAHPRARSSVHLGESRDEIEFLQHGGGAIREAIERLGAWSAAWTAPGCGPVPYLARFGMLNARVLMVHAVQLSDDELVQVAAADATIVTCPRSNRWTGAGTPPIDRFYGSGVRVALGTDSLASVGDLNLFAEIAAAREIAPGVPARMLIESATRCGADALGFGDELGTIEAGKRAELIAVRLPPGLEDVEEYLLGGIEPADVRWLTPPQVTLTSEP